MSWQGARRFTGEAAVAKLALRREQESNAAASQADSNAPLQVPATTAAAPAPVSTQPNPSQGFTPMQHSNGFSNPRMAAPPQVPASQGYANPRMPPPAVPASQGSTQIRPNGFANPRMAVPPQAAAAAPESIQHNASQGTEDHSSTPSQDSAPAPASSQGLAAVRPYDRSYAFANPPSRMGFPPQASAAAPAQQNAPIPSNGAGFSSNPRMAMQPEASTASPAVPISQGYVNPRMPPPAAPAQVSTQGFGPMQHSNGFSNPRMALPAAPASQGYANPRMAVPPQAPAAAPESIQQNASQGTENHSSTPSQAAAPAAVSSQQNAPQGLAAVRPYDRSYAFANPPSRMGFPPQASAAAPAQQNAPILSNGSTPAVPAAQGYVNPRMAFPSQASTTTFANPRMPPPAVHASQGSTQIRPNGFANPRMAAPPQASAPATFQQNPSQAFAPYRPRASAPFSDPRMTEASAPESIQRDAPPSSADHSSTPFQAIAAAPAVVSSQQNAPQAGYAPIRPHGVPFDDPPARMAMQPEAAAPSTAPIQQNAPRSTEPLTPSQQAELDKDLNTIKEKIIQTLRYYTGIQNMATALTSLFKVDIQELMDRFRVQSVEELFQLMGFGVQNKCLVGFEGTL